MIWDQLSSGGLAALDRNIPVLLNLAATEQHGGHLPLSTDRLIGGYFCGLLHEELGDRVLILPPVAIGCSDHHMDFPGSLTLSHGTFSALVQDIVGSVFHHGFNKIILLNSHGGNQAVMQMTIEKMGAAHPGAHIVGATWWSLAKEALLGITESGVGGTGHACEFETSLMQVIAPELVKTDKIGPGGNVATFPWAEGDMLHGPAASYYRTMKTMTPNGVYGNPLFASPEKGRAIAACVVESLKRVVLDLYGA